ncbi:MAG: response regulator [Sphingomonas sp.]|uniref:hybrid sensor histidine kinase/response regulator n=1 Tax=Sphingomonas sp. TaxID=28214 RepID=UPI002275D6FB|nr:response regulator [Sphingomonas sp.]MCX8477369.1 response regulator [Sphingomonas sp.]
MPRDPYLYFRAEARELQDALVKGALDLEKGEGEPGLVTRLLRLAHTLKGAARIVKQRAIADRAHAIEELLDPYREAGAAPPREAIDGILRMLDEIGGHVADLGADRDAAPDRPPSADEPLRMLRADVFELDALLEGVTETRTRLEGARRTLDGFGDVRGLVDGLGGQRAASDLRAALAGLQRKLSASIDQVDRELRQLRGGAEKLRLVPAGALFNPLERTARDVAQSLGKRVGFAARGGEVRLDGHVLEVLQGALVQLVRNAAAHGIETADRRRAADKQEEGRIALTVERRGGRIAFACADDGGGLDEEALRRAARAKGIAIPDRPGAEGLLRLLLGGGLSTAGSVTEVSGRGIGLDIVRDAMERLGGEVAVRSAPGTGTTIELLVPLSVASIGAMQFETGADVFAIPLDAIRRVMRFLPREIARTADGEAVTCDGRTIPFVPIASLLGGAAGRTHRAARRPALAAIVEGAGGDVALGVDRLAGIATLVLRPLPDLAPAMPIVAGVSMDADGNPQLVLDPDALATAVRRAALPQAAPEVPPRPVLVIDDSLTTRMLEQSILESAGYRVDTAASAEEGLEAARRGDYGLILVDVEMPGMDGFGFIETIRRDSDLCAIPALLVTSRAAPEDKKRGREVGAQGYIVKSEFDQGAFLDRIRQLLV